MNLKKLIQDIINEKLAVKNNPKTAPAPVRTPTRTPDKTPSPRPSEPSPIKFPNPGEQPSPKGKKGKLKSHTAFQLNRSRKNKTNE